MGAEGWDVWRTIPPSFTEPVSTGWAGSLTSNCFSSPEAQHETYRKRSSTDRSMSVMIGGSSPNPLSNGGR